MTRLASEPSVDASRTAARFINPHRLFHGVWLPQWLEERSEVSERARKLYAYLTYFAGGQGCAWASFNHLAEKLHVSRRYVIRLVQELSSHGLVSVTNANNPLNGHCANYYRFLWHPWMQTVEDSDFYMAVRENEPPFSSGESPTFFGQGTRTPVRGVGGALLQSDVDYFSKRVHRRWCVEPRSWANRASRADDAAQNVAASGPR